MSDPTPRGRDAGRHICVLIPAFNEEEVLPDLYLRLSGLSDRCAAYSFTFLFVDDGSSDDTLRVIERLRRTDKRISWLTLSRNFGKEAAMLAGLDAVPALDADALVLIDADLQDPPELIAQMLAAWERGYEDVYARRRSRAGESWLKKATSQGFYLLLQKSTRIQIQRDTGDFRLLDRRAVDAMCSFREHERYTKGLFSLVGFRKYELLYDRDARAGQTKWNYARLFDLALDGITSFTTRPLRLATYLGFIVATVAFVEIVALLAGAGIFDHHNRLVLLGYVSLVLLGGVQLVALGVVGEYVGRIFIESKNRPLYIVRDGRLAGGVLTSSDRTPVTDPSHPPARYLSGAS